MVWRRQNEENSSFLFLKWLLCFPFTQLSPAQVPDTPRTSQSGAWLAPCQAVLSRWLRPQMSLEMDGPPKTCLHASASPEN